MQRILVSCLIQAAPALTIFMSSSAYTHWHVHQVLPLPPSLTANKHTRLYFPTRLCSHSSFSVDGVNLKTLGYEVMKWRSGETFKINPTLKSNFVSASVIVVDFLHNWFLDLQTHSLPVVPMPRNCGNVLLVHEPYKSMHIVQQVYCLNSHSVPNCWTKDLWHMSSTSRKQPCLSVKLKKDYFSSFSLCFAVKSRPWPLMVLMQFAKDTSNRCCNAKCLPLQHADSWQIEQQVEKQ